MKQVIKELNMHYYTSIAVLAILLLASVFVKIEQEWVTAVVERYAIVATLIAIPLALKLFADKIKKAPKEIDNGKAIKLYRNAYFLRLYTLNFAAAGNILLYAWSRNSNFMWLSVVLLVVFLFCKPSLIELENITKREE